MSVHQCPRCDLRFSWQTELDYHCREEHPEFHHEYVTRSSSGPAPARTRPADSQRADETGAERRAP